MEYIVVQAGGRGSRLGYLTDNKPKALVPIDNLPMLFHLFKKYPDKRFIIIADYKREVLREYLDAFADVKFMVVDATGTGTCSGIKQALNIIPNNESFMLIWSDLILPNDFQLPSEYDEEKLYPQKDYIGLSQTFSCRWKYQNHMFFEEQSKEYGVAGLFLFTDKSKLVDVPESGELVRWMQNKQMEYETVGLAGTKEFGLLEEYNKMAICKCRPFNRISIEGGKLTKEPIDVQGKELAKRERAWYEQARDLGIDVLPEIYNTEPLVMEYIDGKNIYECDLTFEEKRELLNKLIVSLKELHGSSTRVADRFSIKEAYYTKTMNRLSKIQDLIPYGREREITINGRKCRNVFYHKRELEKKLDNLVDDCSDFAFIHGDCTFSNMMVRRNGKPILIDPRGYFGFTELYGDVRYDWTKIYYSIVGNYDQFNLKKFNLAINENADIELEIESNHWEDMEELFFQMTGVDEYEIKLLHAVIWLSLTTYAWQDFDSVCGAFYNGLWYLEEVL